MKTVCPLRVLLPTYSAHNRSISDNYDILGLYNIIGRLGSRTPNLGWGLWVRTNHLVEFNIWIVSRLFTPWYNMGMLL